MNGLAARRILVVEDEPVLAMMVEDLLADLGCCVVGPALRLAEAETLAREERLDGAVLDVNIGGEASFAVADILARRSIPFCFATGYGEAGIPARFRSAPVLQKPYRPETLRDAVGDCIAEARP